MVYKEAIRIDKLSTHLELSSLCSWHAVRRLLFSYISSAMTLDC